MNACGVLIGPAAPRKVDLVVFDLAGTTLDDNVRNVIDDDNVLYLNNN